jgi:DNA primase catalytic subunit
MSAAQSRLAGVPFHCRITTETACSFSSDRRDQVASYRLHIGLLTLTKVVRGKKLDLHEWGVVTDVVNRIAPLDGATIPVCR